MEILYLIIFFILGTTCLKNDLSLIPNPIVSSILKSLL